MSDETSTAIIPQENSEFIPNQGKNSTMVGFDMEHNAAFIQEFKEKMELCGSSNDIELLKSEFKKMTGVDFDEICPEEKPAEETPSASSSETQPVDVKEVTEEEPDASHSSTEEVSTEKDDTDTVEVHETPESQEDDELLQKALNQVDEYLADPDKLKFTEDDINKIVKIGVFDYETIKMLVEKTNEDIDLIKKGPEDETSHYHDEKVRREAIINQIKTKISVTEASEAASQLTSPEIIKEIFNANFPEYEPKGPAYILERFASYLNSRMVNDAEIASIVHELNNYQKLTEILDHANENIFDNLLLTDGKKYSVGLFIKAVFVWNHALIATLFGIEESKLEMKSCESLLITFTVLFVRWMYKNMVPDMKHRAIHRMLFQRFVFDNSNPLTLSGEKFEDLSKSWEHVLELSAKLSIEAAKQQKIQ